VQYCVIFKFCNFPFLSLTIAKDLDIYSSIKTKCASKCFARQPRLSALGTAVL
jgi:hypothetical protein